MRQLRHHCGAHCHDNTSLNGVSERDERTLSTVVRSLLKGQLPSQHERAVFHGNLVVQQVCTGQLSSNKRTTRGGVCRGSTGTRGQGVRVQFNKAYTTKLGGKTRDVKLCGLNRNSSGLAAPTSRGGGLLWKARMSPSWQLHHTVACRPADQGTRLLLLRRRSFRASNHRPRFLLRPQHLR